MEAPEPGAVPAPTPPEGAACVVAPGSPAAAGLLKTSSLHTGQCRLRRNHERMQCSWKLFETEEPGESGQVTEQGRRRK